MSTLKERCTDLAERIAGLTVDETVPKIVSFIEAETRESSLDTLRIDAVEQDIIGRNQTYVVGNDAGWSIGIPPVFASFRDLADAALAERNHSK
jgi:hypothetical protein